MRQQKKRTSYRPEVDSCSYQLYQDITVTLESRLYVEKKVSSTVNFTICCSVYMKLLKYSQLLCETNTRVEPSSTVEQSKVLLIL